MFKRTLVYALCFGILNLGSPLVARAELIGTLQAVDAGRRAQDLRAVEATLSREDVRKQFAAMGVDPAQVDARVAQLTDPELRSLAERMNQMPAGAGALEVIGVVFLVLLILEAVGVIDIFKKFP